jgi:hypothetical protein
MRVAHRKSVESRAQKRTNVGGIRPDGCGVLPLLASQNKNDAVRLLSSLYRLICSNVQPVTREDVSSTAGTERNYRRPVHNDCGPRSAFARLCVPPCSRTGSNAVPRRNLPCHHPEGMDGPASVLFLLQITRHLVAARGQGAAGGRSTEAFGCGHRCLIYPLRAVTLRSTGE